MEWIWLIITISILFCFLLACRLVYIRGYKTGAKRVIAKWRKSEEEIYNDEDVSE